MRRIGNSMWALWFWALLYLLGASYLAGAQATPNSAQPSSSTEPSEQQTTLSWQDLEALSEELSNKAAELPNLAADSRIQSDDLKAQAEKLQSSLSDSVTLLAQSLDMRKQEDKKAQAAVKAALNRSAWWQRGAFVVAGGFVGYLIKGWEGAAYGASAGALSDAALEIAFAIKIKL